MNTASIIVLSVVVVSLVLAVLFLMIRKPSKKECRGCAYSSSCDGKCILK